MEPSFSVKVKTYIQATAILPPETILIILSFVAGGIANRFLGKIGEKVYDKIENTIVNRLFKGQSKENKTIRFEVRSGNTAVSLECDTNDPVVAKAALDTLPKLVDSAKGSASYFFNNNIKQWEEVKDAEVWKTATGVAAVAGPIKINGKKLLIPRQSLEKMANSIKGMSFLIEHQGKPIGRFTRGWMEGDKLCYEVEIFKPADAKAEEELEKILSEKKGVSIAFGYDEDESHSESK